MLQNRYKHAENALYTANLHETNFIKYLDIERIPKYLVLVLKRFKYTLMHMDKIEYLINFPTDHLNLKDYTSQKKFSQNWSKMKVFCVCTGSSISGGKNEKDYVMFVKQYIDICFT